MLGSQRSARPCYNERHGERDRVCAYEASHSSCCLCKHNNADGKLSTLKPGADGKFTINAGDDVLIKEYSGSEPIVVEASLLTAQAILLGTENIDDESGYRHIHQSIRDGRF